MYSHNYATPQAAGSTANLQWAGPGSETANADGLTRLDLEVEGDEGEDEALRGEYETTYTTHLEVLDEVVEDTQALGVRALVDVRERANLGRLGCECGF